MSDDSGSTRRKIAEIAKDLSEWSDWAMKEQRSGPNAVAMLRDAGIIPPPADDPEPEAGP